MGHPETVTHLERIGRKEDVLMGKGRAVERKAADLHPSLLLPPFANIDCAAGLD